MTTTRIVKLDPKAIDQRIIIEAAGLLEQGGLVVFPTETVYGIAANLLNKKAFERLVKIKDRPENKQFSVHLSDKNDIEKYAVDILPRAYKMIEKFWPGPLTIVLNAPDAKTVGLRMPKNEVALRLLENCDFPVIAPSANLSGKPAPMQADSILGDLDGLVDMIIDSGPTELGKESTVLDARALPFQVLREGFLKKEEVLKVAQTKSILFVCTGNSCRSVMAEFLLKKRLIDLGRNDVEVSSAGTLAFLGMGPTRETLRLVNEIGLDASSHRAQRITREMLKSSDLILAMEKGHRDEILRHLPEAKQRVHILGEYASLENGSCEVFDPIGRSEEFYRMSFEKIKKAIERMEI